MHFVCLDDDGLNKIRNALQHYEYDVSSIRCGSMAVRDAVEAERYSVYTLRNDLCRQYAFQPRVVLITTASLERTVLRPSVSVIGTINLDDVSANELKRICAVANAAGQFVFIAAEYELCYDILYSFPPEEPT